MILMLDPGHGVKDPGAIGTTGVKEADLNLKIANRTKNMLANYMPTFMTREYGDMGCPSLSNRVEYASYMSADLLVSIHCNAHATNAKGLEVYYKPGDGSSVVAYEILQTIQKCCANAGYSYTNRGIKDGSKLYMTREPHCQAVLIECGFITNPDEEKWLTSPIGQVTIAYAIAMAILKIQGVK